MHSTKPIHLDRTHKRGPFISLLMEYYNIALVNFDQDDIRS